MSWQFKELNDEVFDTQCNISNASSLESAEMVDMEEFSDDDGEYEEIGDAEEDIEGYEQPNSILHEASTELRPNIHEQNSVEYQYHPKQNEVNNQIEDIDSNRESINKKSTENFLENSRPINTINDNEYDVSIEDVSSPEKKPQTIQEYVNEQKEQNVTDEIDIDDEQFESLTNEELMEIFNEFKPLELELETLFTPFLTEYQPAICEPDLFIKIERPDEKEETLGLVVADEPCLNESYKLLLEKELLKLYQINNINADFKDELTCNEVEYIKNPTENDQFHNEINTYIKNIENTEYEKEFETDVKNYYEDLDELFSREMCESLEELFDGHNWAHIDLSTQQFLEFCCAMLDIEFDEEHIIESCYELFSVFEYIKEIKMTNFE